MGVVRLPGVEFIFRVKPTVGPLHSRPRFFISIQAVGTSLVAYGFNFSAEF